MLRGKFDTDMGALEKRIDFNANDFDLESWMLQKCEVKPLKILDLGSGTGKQVARMRVAFPDAKIISVDKSDSFRQGEFHNVSAIKKDFDEYEPEKDEKFDLITSAYAIYYSRDMPSLIERAVSWLAPGGELVLVGPDEDNNGELFDEIFSLCGVKLEMRAFMEEEDAKAIAKCAGKKLDAYRTKNTILFDSPSKVLDWWRNHNTFCEQILKEHGHEFRTDRLTKNILLLRIS